MSTKEIISKIEALAEWEAIIEEAKAEAELIKDEIKAEMDTILDSAITKTTESTLTNSYAGGLVIDSIDGKSEQNTTTGKNHLEIIVSSMKTANARRSPCIRTITLARSRP